jgi:hypothetical protein
MIRLAFPSDKKGEMKMMNKKKRTVFTWIMLVLILIGMLAYIVFFINGSPEGAEEIDEATGIIQQTAE